MKFPFVSGGCNLSECPLEAASANAFDGVCGEEGCQLGLGAMGVKLGDLNTGRGWAGV